MSDHLWREHLQRDQPIREIWRWLRNQIIQEVPEDSALCEFDCRKGQCTMEEWETCDRRLNKAAGELMPSSRKISPRQD
jgi:uncharacterized protein YecT (DUF1311 family)